MPRTTDFASMHCSIARAFDVLGESWTPLILRDIFGGLTRFEALQADLGVARAVLSTRLGRLVDEGILDRQAYDEGRGRHDYRLTDKGLELVTALLPLLAWSDRWLDDGHGAPMTLVHGACGEPTAAATVCGVCGEPLAAGDIELRPGPGGRQAPGTMLIGGAVSHRPDPGR